MCARDCVCLTLRAARERELEILGVTSGLQRLENSFDIMLDSSVVEVADGLSIDGFAVAACNL